MLALHSFRDGLCSCRKGGCANPAKHPRLAHGFKDATTDPTILESWWTRWPDANLGIATGALCGLVVVDVDPRHGGEDSLTELERIHGPLPDSPQVLTGGGGRHFYLLHPGTTLRNRAAILPGIDIRADGGYVVAPPSRTVRNYSWKLFHHPYDLPLAPVPAWLLELIEGPRQSLRNDVACLRILTGERNDTLIRLAGLLRFHGWCEGS